jgi:hypothetical protein
LPTKIALPAALTVALLLNFNLTAAAQVRLTDVTEAAGVTFRHVASPDKRYIVESMSGGVALFDYDADGWLDLFLVNSLTVELVRSGGKTRSALYRNQGDGTFKDVTDRSGLADVGWGMGVAAGDFDNDGRTDLYVTCLGPNRLYRNNGDGTFADVTLRAGVSDPRWSTGAAFVDYDNDGRLDLFVANYVDFQLDRLPEFGKGKTCQYKGVAVQCGPRGLPGAGDSLFRNNGDGTFTDVSKKAGVADPQGFYGLGVVCSDFDEDGLTDIFVANDSTPNFLYKNNGDGTFKDVGFVSGTAVNENGSEQGSMGVTVGDYDHDGKFDVFVTNFADEYNTLYKGGERLNFSDVSYAAKLAEVALPLVGWGTEFFDYDNDGWVDLFVANGHVYPQLENYKQRKLLHRNNRDGTFTETAVQAGAPLLEKRAARGTAFGDMDNDGDVDVVVGDLDGPPQVLRNDGGNAAGGAVLIRLVGTRANRDAVGARVKISAGDLVQMDEVRSGASYISHSDLRLHFGVGARTKIDSIEVRWPGGAVEKISGAPANKILTIKEGQGLVEQRDFNRAAATPRPRV